jgi:Vitamin B12 dependent methionine synthase, activation domain
VLGLLGIPADVPLPRHIEQLYAAAKRLLAQHATPAGILADISAADFATVFHGEGANEPRTPVAEIFPRAHHLALFAVTLGDGIGGALGECFAAGDFALAYTLDAMASAAADGIAEQAERRFGSMLAERGWSPPYATVLRYSPGYCGWNVSGQTKLFRYLQPATIGLTLTDSCVMQPLKSVSGVMIAGPREIHRFPPTYDFCEQCETRTCRARLRALFAPIT